MKHSDSKVDSHATKNSTELKLLLVVFPNFAVDTLHNIPIPQQYARFWGTMTDYVPFIRLWYVFWDKN